ncbi:phage tail protein [Acinetobacter qingfengensis]|uniref:Phage tail protein n=1 Tax=Acinetobacter qingfengensis TaxID=1262585 RepID=A0A1E7RBZ2_9GAMM|nr:tail protein X [Acinetobacter qingfengensis]KAA8734922.1 phage tail protein [Acinetobacter qingfengensis]OEY96910.1 phage tail protein [Acinetobacter qingfengensis]
MTQTITAIQNDTIDSICWRYYGRSAGVVEKVLEANPKLADIGVILPIGTEVILPDIDTPQQTKQTIQLWD